MAVRSVSVRYSASMGGLLADLERAARANDRLATRAQNAGTAQEKSARRASNAAAEQKAAAEKAAAAQEKSADRQAKAGAVVILGLGVAISKFAEFDAAMSGAAAASSATGSELGNLRDAAIKAGADTQYSATEAANAITELSKAGISTSDILGGGLTGALNLAAAGQLNVADAAEIAATAMTQFKLGGDQVNHVADLLAAGANKAQGGVGDLGMALKQSGLVAQQTGLSIEETTAGLTAFASAGLIGSDAGTSFKSMLQRLTPQSVEAANLMDELGISAYDTSGNFIGLEKFAGVLQSRLKDLTPEQRNSALATIFGSDAVRAASILYNQGATGIAKWTKEVNEQGYAAKQAATLTDNLKGDIERLGGSLDTALIQTGSGANDSLRTLVQTANALVDAIGALPGPVLTGTLAFGGMLLLGPKVGMLARGAMAPLNASMATFSSRAAYASAQAVGFGVAAQGAGTKSLTAGQRIRVMGTAMGGLKGAASGALSLLGGPWGIALMAATAGITMWAQKQADARAAADALSATIDEQTGKFTDNSRQSVISALMGSLSPEDVRAVQALGVSFTDLADAALKGGPAFDEQRAKLVDLANEHQKGLGVFSQEGRALSGLLDALNLQGEGADAARLKQEALNRAKNEAAVADSNQAGSANAAERGITDAGNAASDAAPKIDEVGSKSDESARFMAKMGAKSQEATDALAELANAIDLMAGGERALRASQRGLADSLDKLVEAQQAKVDKTHTAAQVERDYRAALDEVGSSTDEVLKRQMDQNASVAELTKTYNDQRAAIRKSLEDHGVNKKQLDAETDSIIGTRGEFQLLLDRYKQNPGQVATTIKTPGLPQAKAQVQGYWEVVNGVPRFKQTNVSAPGAPAAKNQLHDVWVQANGIPNYVEVRVDVFSNAQAAVADINATLGGIAGTVTRRAAGGPISGPGTGTSDSVPALLSDGEHVLTADDVADAGGHGAIYRMRAAIQSGQLRFAAGGAVARQATLARYAGGGAVAAVGSPAVPAAGGGIDLAALAAIVRQGGGDTFNSYGLDIDEALAKAQRAKEFREMSRVP